MQQETFLMKFLHINEINKNYRKMLKLKKVLITGSAGFIGFHCAKKILEDYPKCQVYGIDNFNKNYEIKIKTVRNQILKKYKNYKFFKKNLNDRNFIKNT